MPHLQEYILSYDISNRRRLQRVARLCQSYGIRLQYSVFYLRITNVNRDALVAKLNDIINPDEDDIRLYQISSHKQIIVRGRNLASAGIYCDFDAATV